MSSPAKISANRENARKSTGPRSERGKSNSKLNALKFGIYSTTSVLPGEDEDAYQEIAKSNLSHFAPVGPVESVLVTQITTEQWQLERIRGAENVLPARLVEGQIVRLLGSLIDSEMAYVSSLYSDQLSEEIAQARRAQEAAGQLLQLKFPAAGRLTPRGSDEEMKDGVEGSLRRILDPDNILVDGLIPSAGTAPQTFLVHERRVAMRAYLAYVSKLQALQEARQTVTLSSRTQPRIAEEHHSNSKRSAAPLIAGDADE